MIIRSIAFALGFLVARELGFESVLLFCFGCIIAPFFVIPVWRVWAAVKPPVLIHAGPHIITLNLRGGPLK